MKKYNAEEAKEYREKQMNDATKQLEEGLKSILSSENYKAWLITAAMFPNYSINNQVMIMMQNPHATNVCSFSTWKKLERNVNKGAKGIKIFAPNPFTVYRTVKKKDENGNYIKDENGAFLTEKVPQKVMGYKIVTVFDISDTNGKELPEMKVNELKGDVDHYPELLQALISVSPVPVEFAAVNGDAKGYFSHTERRIVVREGMDELQSIKTLVHEIGHSLTHSDISNAGLENNEKKRNYKEIQAESIAYIVCRNLGLDTSDYSFPYIAGWNEAVDMDSFKESLDSIKKTAAYIIENVNEMLEHTNSLQAEWDTPVEENDLEEEYE